MTQAWYNAEWGFVLIKKSLVCTVYLQILKEQSCSSSTSVFFKIIMIIISAARSTDNRIWKRNRHQSTNANFKTLIITDKNTLKLIAENKSYIRVAYKCFRWK